MTAERIAQFLLLEPDFPRSARFCVMGLSRHFARATVNTPASQALPARREIELLNLDSQRRQRRRDPQDWLARVLDGLQQPLAAIDEAIRNQIFRALPEAAS